ncbi:signal peptidase I [Corynebacterium guangdongense]|uniref:Signal peptidase I n=1 Tax=Corynebacterium guangdongense TaxID=1783348 RepID=A0ABU1ZXE1_9CORY|nr:signal peptidase I [Corynebacterium guangdongense]MDR7329609.1 signal peptidase I [Corynebacterium guangdongense]WJZ18174.1 Signal peptidase I [Corynebacterium guangdongense]
MTHEHGEAATEKTGVMPAWLETIVVFLATLVVLGLVSTFVGRMYVIPSASMEPTLHGCAGCTGDRIVAEKISYYASDPEPGDVIVFAGTDSWNAGWSANRSDNPVIYGLQEVGEFVGFVAPDENILVKRIIAEGGQTVSCQAGDPAVMVDGQPTDHSYTLQPAEYPVDPAVGSEACGGMYFGPVEVPEGTYFMMGDNRTNSLDSRYHTNDPYNGAIPEENVRGKVQWIVFPFSRIGAVADPAIQPQQAA